MVDGDAAAATDGPKSARGRARVGCARGGEAASLKFELTEHLVTTVNHLAKPTSATLSFRRRAMGSIRGLGFEGRVFIGGNFGKLSKSGVEIESPR